MHHGGILVVFILDEDGAAINRLRLLLPLLLEKSVKMCLLAIGQPVNIFYRFMFKLWKVLFCAV